MSVPLNIAEGAGSRGGRRRARYDDALGSARETLANLEAASAVGYLRSIGLPLRSHLNQIAAGLFWLRRATWSMLRA
jgi:four helix bundle protein